MLAERTDRGVSTVVGYILALSITTILVGGLIVSSSTFLRSQQERVAQESLGVIGEQVATGIAAADAPPNPNSEKVIIGIPEQVAGQQYRIEFRKVGSPTTEVHTYRITLTTDSPPVSVEVPVTTSREIKSGVSGTTDFAVNGGDIVIHTKTNASGKQILVIRNE